MDHAYIRIGLATLISLGLSYHGLKKKSLDLSGALAALIVGFISFATSYQYGMTLILFYYVSSKLTKMKEDIKKKLEDHFLTGGQRNYLQVFANSILATIICIISLINYRNESSLINFDDGSYQYSILQSIYVAHYACACGDTWASELGILSTETPRLITTLLIRKVPRGTNGGITILGTVASAAGGLFIGIVYWLFSLDVVNDGFADPHHQYPIIVLGLISGFIGSVYDSILGGFLQATYYSKRRQCIVKGKPVSDALAGDDEIVHICGINVLSNEAVNFISIAMTMFTIAYIAPLLFLSI